MATEVGITATAAGFWSMPESKTDEAEDEPAETGGSA
jgi:hypothetical protein